MSAIKDDVTAELESLSPGERQKAEACMAGTRLAIVPAMAATREIECPHCRAEVLADIGCSITVTGLMRLIDLGIPLEEVVKHYEESRETVTAAIKEHATERGATRN